MQGIDQLKWQRRKAWQLFSARAKETYSKLGLWHTSLKKIGGNLGMGMVAYFLFIRWILFLNIILFASITLFLILPTVLLEVPQDKICDSINNNTICCTEMYWNKTKEFDKFIDFFQGINLFEYSLLFYGAYSSSTNSFDKNGLQYNLPLAYLGVMIAVFGSSLLAVVRSAVKGFRERVVESEGQFYRYCNLAFGGWDYCINNEKASETKHKALHNEIKVIEDFSNTQQFGYYFIILREIN